MTTQEAQLLLSKPIVLSCLE